MSEAVRLEPFNAFADATLTLSDWRLKQMLAYWRQKAGERSLPDRADIAPGEFVKHLPSVYMIDVLAAGPDPTAFRFRLFGTALVDLLGREPTGLTLSEALGEESARALAAVFATVARYRAPMRFFGELDWLEDGVPACLESIAMPLSHRRAKGTDAPAIIFGELIAFPAHARPAFPEMAA